MTAAKTAEKLSPGLLRVLERAKRDPEGPLFSLAHHINVDALNRAYRRIRKDAAVGVDGVTKEQYGQKLDDNVRGLHERLRTTTYRHQPILRVLIPKDQGKKRPIGISSIEDKIVQGALRELLEAIYEPMFLECSYGFRPGRSAHNAMRALDHGLYSGEVNWILEGDIQTFFDSIDRKVLMEMLRGRVADQSLLRLVGKCLHVGVLDGEEYSEPGMGTVQGSVLSPLLGNIYLHHVLDRWVERDVRPRLQGRVHLVRYADDFVLGFSRKDDADKVMAVLGKRFERFGLKLHPDKTRLLPFRRPPRGRTGGGPGSFDFLGFTVYWMKDQVGRWRPALKTRKARLRRAIVRLAAWCRSHRHDSVTEQSAALGRRIEGHFNYFGVNGNLRSLRLLIRGVEVAWRQALSRRGQRRPVTWKRFRAIVGAHPLPEPSIRVQVWATS